MDVLYNLEKDRMWMTTREMDRDKQNNERTANLVQRRNDTSWYPYASRSTPAYTRHIFDY